MPDSSTTAITDRAAAKPKAGPAPIQPTSRPPSAGPLAKATVRANSMRALAAGRDDGDTNDGTSDGVATLYITVPHTATKPSARLSRFSNITLPSDNTAVVKCSTSLWSADLANLAEAIRRVEPYSDRFHLDVADGHYVPNLLFFPDLVRALP